MIEKIGAGLDMTIYMIKPGTENKFRVFKCHKSAKFIFVENYFSNLLNAFYNVFIACISRILITYTSIIVPSKTIDTCQRDSCLSLSFDIASSILHRPDTCKDIIH